MAEQWQWVRGKVGGAERFACLKAGDKYVLTPQRTHDNEDWINVSQAHAELIAAAPETAAERDKLSAMNAELLEALELAANELNIIRARDGAPQHVWWDKGTPHQDDGCTQEWWNELTEKCFAAITKATTP